MLWNVEMQALNLLHDATLNVDRQILILFKKGQGHKRDSRPLTMAARLLTKPTQDMKKSIWKATPIVQGHGRTDPAEQLHPSLMLQLDCVDASALPSSTDPDTGVTGAYRFAQFGSDMWVKLFQALQSGLKVETAKRCAPINRLPRSSHS